MTDLQTPPDGKDFSSLLENKNRGPFYKDSIFQRLAGFVLMGIALLIMYAYKQGWLPEFFRLVSFGTAGSGLVVYFLGRIRAFGEQKRKRAF